LLGIKAELYKLIEEIRNMIGENEKIIAERKERLKKTMDFQEPDRVPVNTGFPLALWASKKGIPFSHLLSNPYLQFSEQLRSRIYRFRKFDDDYIPTPDEVVINVGVEIVEASVIGCRIHFLEDDHPWLDLSFAPLSSPQAIKDFKVPEEDELINLGIMPKIKEFIDVAHANGLKVTGIADGEGPFELACFAYGTTEFLMLMKDDPGLAKELIRKMTLLRIRQSKIFQRWCDVFNITVGENNIDLISPDQFEKFVFPYDLEIFRNFPDSIPIWHTDACADNILDFVVEYGIKTFQVSDTTNLKLAKSKLARYKITCTGNLPGSLFAFGTPDRVEEAARKCIEEAAGGGGYILSPNDIMRDAKEENLIALINAAKKYGRY